MKAKNLRLGNLITNKEGEIETVFTLHDKYINGYDGESGLLPDDESDYNGVKLTEKWIIELGLKRIPENEYTLDSYDLAGFKLWMNKGKFLFINKINIEYVHQLQNLFFALTGTELDVKDEYKNL